MAARSLPKSFDHLHFLRMGWQTLQDNVSILVQIFIVYILASFIPQFLLAAAIEEQPIISLANWLWQMFVSLGVMRVVLKITQGKKTALGDMFNGVEQYMPFVIGNILYMFRVMLGFLLLIVPGIVWAIKFQFVPVLVIDKKLSATDAFLYSQKLTHGFKWKLFVFNIVLIFFNILGLIALIVGVLLTSVISYLAYMHVYRYLDAKISPTKKPVKKAVAKRKK